jgi:hypothetical protein
LSSVDSFSALIAERAKLRHVTAETTERWKQASVAGPNEAEVIGLAGLLDEVLRALIPIPRQEEEVEAEQPEPAQPEYVQPKPGRWRRFRRWWSGRQVGTQLLIGIVGSLIATGIIAAIIALVA